jgi:hypothetical protein
VSHITESTAAVPVGHSTSSPSPARCPLHRPVCAKSN